MRKALGVFAIVICTLWFAAPAMAGTELVTNGGFEGSYTGWTQGGDTSFDFLDPARAHSGNFAADLGAFLDTSSLSQTLTATNVGETLHVTFWVAYDLLSPELAGPVSTFVVTLGGNQILSLNDVTATAGSYVGYSFDLTAPSTSFSLTFTAENDSDFWSLDDVSVSAPEPQTLMLLGPALAGLALLRRRS